ncbi:MAG: hypothetical protein P4L36_18140 [Holophaga sp.]|nr:hypothetical protein [Holophaga sp.]
MSPNRYVLACSAAAIVAAAPAYASHPRDFATVLPPLMQTGDLTPAEHLFLKDATSSGRNQLLYLYEMASFYRMIGEVGKSIDLFAAADKVAHDYESRAVVSAGGVAGQAGAALTNDTVLPWEGACQDKVMARTLNAMNYLMKQDLEGARVEVKKAEEYQVMERTRRQKALAKAAQKDQNAAEADVPAPNPKFREMYSYARNARNSYENAFTYYLSSNIYSAQGPAGLNDALVDIKRAYELAPNAPAIQEAYLDLAAQAQDTAALEALETRLGIGRSYQPVDHSRTGTVVVVFEAGFVPPLSEVSINMPVSGKLFSLAFPIYNDFKFPQPALRIQTPAGGQTTSKVVDMRLLEVKALQERIPEIITRGTIGAAAKIEAQKKASDNFGPFGGLIASIATKVVTSADLRSWLSLPAEVQSAHFFLPPGGNELTLSSYDWSEKIALDVAPGSTTFLMVKATPGFRTIKTASIRGGF